MRAELDQLLCKRYPEIFLKRNHPESGMARGFECDDDWFWIIDTLCGLIQFHVAQGNMPPVCATQVKEKFGELRFRYRGGNEMTQGMVHMAEAISSRGEETGWPEPS